MNTTWIMGLCVFLLLCTILSILQTNKLEILDTFASSQGGALLQLQTSRPSYRIFLESQSS